MGEKGYFEKDLNIAAEVEVALKQEGSEDMRQEPIRIISVLRQLGYSLTQGKESEQTGEDFEIARKLSSWLYDRGEIPTVYPVIITGLRALGYIKDGLPDTEIRLRCIEAAAQSIPAGKYAEESRDAVIASAKAYETYVMGGITHWSNTRCPKCGMTHPPDGACFVHEDGGYCPVCHTFFTWEMVSAAR